jgi:hypothetical protein
VKEGPLPEYSLKGVRQLVAASKPLEAWDFDRVPEWKERNRVTLGAHRWPTLQRGRPNG